jgi:DNA replication protein DnaC
MVLTQGNCETHGAYPLNTLDPDGTLRWHSPGCPACRRDAAAHALVSRAAIAPRFAHCTFESYEVDSRADPAAQDERHIAQLEERRRNRDACRAYARDFDKMRAQGACLVLRGLPGTGKNHLATAIAREVLARGYSVLNATAHDLIRRIRDTWDRAPGEKDERAVLRELARVDLLIIDEAGRHYGARDGRDNIELFQVIDARYRALMPTLVISNLEREALRASLGEATFDRLREGGGQMLHFDWPSHRGRAQPTPAPATSPAHHQGEQ